MTTWGLSDKYLCASSTHYRSCCFEAVVSRSVGSVMVVSWERQKVENDIWPWIAYLEKHLRDGVSICSLLGWRLPLNLRVPIDTGCPRYSGHGIKGSITGELSCVECVWSKHDRFAVAITKEDNTIGHIPREIQSGMVLSSTRWGDNVWDIQQKKKVQCFWQGSGSALYIHFSRKSENGQVTSETLNKVSQMLSDSSWVLYKIIFSLFSIGYNVYTTTTL